MKKIDGIEDAARIIALLKKTPPEYRGTMSTRNALEHALLNDLIPPRFADVSVRTFDRVIYELGIIPGVPRKIMVDNGPMMKNRSAKDLFARLGIGTEFAIPAICQSRTIAEVSHD